MLSSTIDVGKGTSSAASGAGSMMMQGVLRERDKLFTRPGEEVRKKDGLVEEIVRSAAGGIGVISEALHHRKEKKANGLQQNQKLSRTQTSPEIAESRPGEAVLTPGSHNNIVDQEATTGEEESRSQKDQKDSGNLAAAFINRHACLPGDHAANGRGLPLPVILPQRRPENRARGFLRAYAPLLADVGIDETTFLDFVDTFNKALEPSPWINALNLAGFAGSAMPEPASMLFGFGVEYATEAALEGHSRYSSNVFLDRVNSRFFHPRGLVCLVVTWQPDIGNNQLHVNFDGEVSASRPNPGVSERIGDMAAQRTSAKDGWQGMKGQIGEMMKMSNGNFNWPEPAPLVFPATKSGMAESGSEDGTKKKKNALDRMEIWMEDMSDKRAQTKWAAENSDKPAASLMPNHEFRSRYADPNHPAASGDLVALVTGGRWTYVDKKKDKKSKKDKESREEEEEEEGGSQGLTRAADSGKPEGDKPGKDDVRKAPDSVKKEASSEEDERDERLKKEEKEKRKEEEKRSKTEKRERERKEKERKEREKKEKKEKKEKERNEKKAKKGNDDKKSKQETDNSKHHEDHEGGGSKDDSDDKSFQRDDDNQALTKEDKDNKEPEHDADSDRLQKEDDRKAKDVKKARKEKEKADKIAKKKKAKDDDWLSSLFQKDVLYLVVINLPSEQQVAAAAQARGSRI
ncbi:hypothetical protein CTA2_2505 [Colletotrichum tanaceti]|uniref:Reticulocyte-binding protein 2-like protein a n=1 Tax=Colletotrichum tanaceti TaxID=1306861 RepID=A0A4V6DHZ0_9PEZI|nr:hypothetical protein CTA2_2505 [Colletotrichum tanaceti]TKW58396.1 hypothetical protein CTA1_5160 [Colletotrichum tanaceti]